MKLSEQDAKLFLQLMWALQFYVNQKLRIHDIKSIDDYAGSATDQKVKVREALYEKYHICEPNKIIELSIAWKNPKWKIKTNQNPNHQKIGNLNWRDWPEKRRN